MVFAGFLCEVWLPLWETKNARRQTSKFLIWSNLDFSKSLFACTSSKWGVCIFLVIYHSCLSHWSLQKLQLLWDRNLTLQNLGSAFLHVGQRPGGIVLQLPDTKGRSGCADGQRALSPGAARGFTVYFFMGTLFEWVNKRQQPSTAALCSLLLCCVAFPAAVRSRTKSLNFSDALSFSDFSPFPSFRSPSTRSLQSPQPRCHLC